MKTLPKTIIIITLLTIFSNISYSQVRYRKVNNELIDSLFKKSYIEKSPTIALEGKLIKSKIESIKNMVVESKKPLPFIFGVENKANLNMRNSGKWHIEKDNKLWILKIKSEDALSINLIFDTLILPESSELFIFNKLKDFLVGPIRAHHNPEGTAFGTDIIKGNEVIIVYSTPIENDNEANISLKYIVHGFREFSEVQQTATSSMTSLASCFKDVYCLSGWQDVSNSVARLIVGGNFCSGTLVNNTIQDGTPILLTAKHCVDNYPEPIDPNAIVFRFKYRKTSCGGSINDTYYTMTGASIKKFFSDADAALLELNNSLPLSEDLYLSGWNRASNLSGYFYNISHPLAAEQQIARAYHSYSLPTSGSNSNMWYPEFTYGGNAVGSSGSALFDANHRIVGGSETVVANAPCGPDLQAEYSKFHIIWDEFKQWLDPANTGVMTLDGKYRCEETLIINRTIDSDETITGCNIRIYNVTIQNNSDVIIDAENNVIIEKDFEVKIGSTLEI